jgi:hypothetical protein
MKKTILWCWILLPWYANAQNDPPPLVASGAYTTDFYKWTFSIGDLAIATFTSGSQMWSQGSQQPELPSVGVFQPSSADFTFELFPNPADQFLRLQVATNGISDRFGVVIYQTDGKRTVVPPIELNAGEVAEMQILALPAGHYVLQISSATGQVSSRIFQKL